MDSVLSVLWLGLLLWLRFDLVPERPTDHGHSQKQPKRSISPGWEKSTLLVMVFTHTENEKGIIWAITLLPTLPS